MVCTCCIAGVLCKSKTPIEYDSEVLHPRRQGYAFSISCIGTLKDYLLVNKTALVLWAETLRPTLFIHDTIIRGDRFALVIASSGDSLYTINRASSAKHTSNTPGRRACLKSPSNMVFHSIGLRMYPFGTPHLISHLTPTSYNIYLSLK